MAAARCPMCQNMDYASADRCDRCCYELGESIETRRSVLQEQLQRTLVWLALLLFVDLCIGTAMRFGLRFGGVMLVAAVALLWTVRIACTLGATWHSLRTLNARLPKATLRAK